MSTTLRQEIIFFAILWTVVLLLQGIHTWQITLFNPYFLLSLRVTALFAMSFWLLIRPLMWVFPVTLAIYKKETESFLSSLIAYIVIIIFLTGMGLFIWVFPETNVLDYGYADLETLFMLAPYVFLFLIPAITMRTFAEERKTKMIELLMTRPVSDWSIILGKYFACFTLVLLALYPTLLYYLSVYQLGSPVGNIDSAGTVGSYIGLMLLGAVFTSIGVFASTLTENQIVSFILAVFLCFVIYQGFTSLASVNDSSYFSYLAIQLGIDYHYNSIRKGLIDSRDLVYFFSIIILMLLSTRFVLTSQKK